MLKQTPSWHFASYGLSIQLCLLFEQPYDLHNKIGIQIIVSEIKLHGLEPFISGGASTLPPRPQLPVCIRHGEHNSVYIMRLKWGLNECVHIKRSEWSHVACKNYKHCWPLNKRILNWVGPFTPAAQSSAVQGSTAFSTCSWRPPPRQKTRSNYTWIFQSVEVDSPRPCEFRGQLY